MTPILKKFHLKEEKKKPTFMDKMHIATLTTFFRTSPLMQVRPRRAYANSLARWATLKRAWSRRAPPQVIKLNFLHFQVVLCLLKLTNFGSPAVAAQDADPTIQNYNDMKVAEGMYKSMAVVNLSPSDVSSV